MPRRAALWRCVHRRSGSLLCASLFASPRIAMPTSSGKTDTAFQAEFWSGALNGITESLGFLMCVTLLRATPGVTRGSLQQLLGAWNFAVSFRREALCCLDVASVSAQKLSTRRHVPPEGALLDNLLLVRGLGPLLQADLRAEPRYERREPVRRRRLPPSSGTLCVVSRRTW